ncbi:uncharacterized protein NPIL_186131 [Nephila pilipes]|uniref:Mutator-like transposase domain-containing protein n=1 Tax=Nephila pilipes TaxID=299642 RepID=A0A8X6T2D3_NEPPI|nr:uncharacterized protein NPIL_186131 [Nephila pilipes]
MRCIGKGAESAVMFCGIMNLPPPPTKFTKFNNILLQAARETCEESMAEAVHEAVEENEGGRDIAVAVDGSWQKRGFSSKNGVVTVTSVDTGKENEFGTADALEKDITTSLITTGVPDEEITLNFTTFLSSIISKRDSIVLLIILC